MPSPSFSWSPTRSRPNGFYQVFKQSVIAGIRGDRWTLPVRHVQAWLDQVREGDPDILTHTTVGADGEVVVSIRPAEP